MITGGQHPDHTRISDFRRVHIEAFAGLFKQTVQLCQEAGLVKLGMVAIDGTKVQGNASRAQGDELRAHAREGKVPRARDRRIAGSRRADRPGLRRARDLTDRFGEGQREEDLPAELRRREGRLEKIRAAKRALEAQAARTRVAELEAQATRNEESATSHPDATERKRAATRAKKRREQAKELSDSFNDDDEGTSGGPTSQGLQTHQTPATPEGTPRPKAQYNFTDPDSRIQESGGAFLQGYNAQAVVDAESQVVVAQAVTNLQPDNSHLQPMLNQTRDNGGALPKVALGDAGYWKPDNVTDAEKCGIDLYVSTRRRKHGAEPPGGSDPDPVAADDNDDNARTQMNAKLQTDQGRAHYARRKAIVEPVFGQIKECRGFRRFLLRGLQKVIGEWSLVTATHNLLKLHRSCLAVAAT